MDRSKPARTLIAAAVASSALVAGVASAQAQTGGTTTTTPPPGSTIIVPPTGTTTPTTPSPLPNMGTLNYDGSVTAPPNAPAAVRKAINAGNRIRYKPYRWGGGHRRWKDSAYDCSGAVSYVLHAAGLLTKPMVSGQLAQLWGAPGIGSWITVYANRSHVYAVIAGIRFDTSSVGEPVRTSSGPRWRVTTRAPSGFATRYSFGL